MRALLPFLIFFLVQRVQAESHRCERLKTSLTYTQEEAPRDLSGVLPVVVERINRVLEGVVDVEVEWTGANLHGRVGEHIVQCKVTRLASVSKVSPDEIYQDDEGRDVFSQCFHVPFTILDTNECALPSGHPMRHRCHESAMCVNTIGSYECLCPRMGENREHVPATVDLNFWENLTTQARGAWELSFTSPGKTTCPGQASTHGCCPEYVHLKGEAVSCRAGFRCPVDPCQTKKNNCAASARCVRKLSPLDEPDYDCLCPEGLMGNGRKCRPGIDLKPEPKVMFDGKTPTETTIKNNFYCDCTTPVVDACSGFPPCKGKHQVCVVDAENKPQCACKSGYVLHGKYGCVDESPPKLRLKHDPNGDQILRLKQGDVYKEYAVDIDDENAEEYMRSLKIAYSEPLPQGCLTKIGEFHVNYTIATPWTSPPYVRITRRVIIDDIDECKLDAALYETTCPALVPRCDTEAGATCVNTIGSYSCKCPQYTTGDGFQHGISFDPMTFPEGFRGGQSCVDTGKPIINIIGPNPKIFRLCECGGIAGIMGKKPPNDELKISQQKHYEDDIRDLIQSTSGAELCASFTNPNPKPSECVKAFDMTYKGRVDLSDEVKVGVPVRKSPLRWSVPYDVKDKAGNSAVTVWRDIVVEEVDILDIETRIRNEAMQDQKEEVQRAVDRAVQERRKIESEMAKKRKSSNSCPACPKCECVGEVDASACEKFCQSKMGSCVVDEQRYAVQVLFFLEQYLNPWLVLILLSCFVIFAFIFFLRLVLTLLFNPKAFRPGYYDSVEREREMLNAITYYQNDHVVANGSLPARRSYSPSTGRAAFADDDGVNFFSPREYEQPSVTIARQDISEDDIYEHSIITPSKRGDGVTRRKSRSPFYGASSSR